jgi:hypothetical protein
MGALDDDFEFVAASVERAARLQRRECRAVLDGGALRGLALARHLDLVYDAVEQRVRDRRAEYQLAPDDTVREDAILEMRQLVWDVRGLQSNLAWLTAAQRPPLDLGTTYFLEDAARALVASRVEVTVVSTEHTSYATSSDPWEPLISAWGKGLPAGEPTVVIVFIPRREERSGLLHPLIMHELGHAADSRHGVVDRVWQAAGQRKRFPKRFSTAVAEFAKATGAGTADANDHIARRLRSWIAESLCDCVALRHLGPTYLYSFLTEVAAGSMDEAGPKHPPPRQRIRLLLENLDADGWAAVLKAGDPRIDAWIRGIAATKVDYTETDGFLTWAVNELRAVVRSEAGRLLVSRVFVPDVTQLSEVAALIEAGIPPAQLRNGRAASRETIILACWQSAIARAGGGPAALATAPDAPELADLLPAALELSAVTAAWSAP